MLCKYLESLGRQMFSLSKILIGIGVLLVLAGLALGKLPGDVAWRSGNTHVYIPIVSSLVISVVLTILFNLFARCGR